MPPLFEGEDVKEIQEQITKFQEYEKQKRNWENAFQRWCNRMAWDNDNTSPYGVCNWGIMCNWCEDNSFGRPCVRALNAWCRIYHKTIDYTDRDFKKVWRGEI